MSEPFVLDNFLPYRFAVAVKTVSRRFSKLYSDQFGISIAEWRIISVVGQESNLSAEQVCDRTTMEKVAVSRAVAKMLDKQILEREFSQQDRRRSELNLSAKGRAIYQKIIPIAQQFEHDLMSDFSDEERALMSRVLEKLIRGT